jgi:hypothetical protein
MMTLVKQNSVSIMKAWKYLQVSTNTYQNDRTVKSNKKISISMFYIYLFILVSWPPANFSNSNISAWVSKPPLSDLASVFLCSLEFCYSPRECCCSICPRAILRTFAFLLTHK